MKNTFTAGGIAGTAATFSRMDEGDGPPEFQIAVTPGTVAHLEVASLASAIAAMTPQGDNAETFAAAERFLLTGDFFPGSPERKQCVCTRHRVGGPTTLYKGQTGYLWQIECSVHGRLKDRLYSDPAEADAVMAAHEAASSLESSR